MEGREPRIADIVHYVYGRKLKCLAAIITQVNQDGTVELHVFKPQGTASLPFESVEYSETPAHDTYHWPERV